MQLGPPVSEAALALLFRAWGGQTRMYWEPRGLGGRHGTPLGSCSLCHGAALCPELRELSICSEGPSGPGPVTGTV